MHAMRIMRAGWLMVILMMGGTPLAADEHTQALSLRYDGRQRTYLLHVPARKPAGKLPLVIALHGGRGRGAGTEKLTGMSAVSDKEGFIVAYPDGVGRTWNDGRELETFKAMREDVDDVGFIGRLIDALVEKHNVDPDRVYVTGISNGGHMAHRLGVELAGRLAAIAPVAATMPSLVQARAGDPAAKISVIQFFGEEDPLNWWKGGGRAGGSSPSVPDMMRWWARRNGCGSEPVVEHLKPFVDDGTRIRRETWPCNDVEVVLYAIEGGGHTWPGGLQYLPEAVIGRTSRNLNSSEVMWEHFKRLRRGRRHIPAME